MTINNRSFFENTRLPGDGCRIQPSVKTKTTITLYERNNYGTTALYATGPLAEAIADLTGRKTLTFRDMNALRRLGFEFDLAHDPKGELVRLERRAA
jgi:hypothetical protein